MYFLQTQNKFIKSDTMFYMFESSLTIFRC